MGTVPNREAKPQDAGRLDGLQENSESGALVRVWDKEAISARLQNSARFLPPNVRGEMLLVGCDQAPKPSSFTQATVLSLRQQQIESEILQPLGPNKFPLAATCADQSGILPIFTGRTHHIPSLYETEG